MFSALIRLMQELEASLGQENRTCLKKKTSESKSKSGVVIQAYNPSTRWTEAGESGRIQGHLWLQSKSETRPGFMRPWLKK